jgi:hypothetical protein
VDSIQVGIEHRQLDRLAVGIFQQQAITALEFVLELAEGGFLGCWAALVSAG